MKQNKYSIVSGIIFALLLAACSGTLVGSYVTANEQAPFTQSATAPKTEQSGEETAVYLPTITNNNSTTITTTDDGYNLFAPLGETTTYLIDENGDIVFTWPSTYRPGNAVYLLENGNLLRTGKTNSSNFETGGVGGIVEEISSDGTVIWSFEHDSGDGRLHHDIEQLSNGNVLMLAWELKSESEALAAGRNTNLLTDQELWPDTIIEVDPTTNNIVWEWHVWDHLVQDYDSNQDNYGVVADHPELIDLNYRGTGVKPGSADWNHINAVDYNVEFDQILLSVRNFSEIWIIDHSTTTAEAAGSSGGNSGVGGNLLYRWGNPQAYDAGSGNDQQLFVQHDAQWIPSGYPGAGNILLFNNGSGRSDGDYSTIDEIVPPVDASGTYSGDGPTTPTWTYTADTPIDFYATNISGAQRLANGNTLICDGPNGYFFEVTAAGEIVWEYDHGNQAIFRVTRIQSDYPGLPTISP
ncbi:MAG: arylsulfotransferase (ASST) [Chloroflexi bacterium]|nr:arylsulfotransferase (ASST) [Chloroflexota bacterium]